jgi:predicted metal-dependent enzyme (double-stranded beta helix superfamily)
MPSDCRRFTEFIAAMTSVIDGASGDETHILRHGHRHVQALIAQDDWLPERLAQPLPGSYGQYLLYRDPDCRFTTVAFVWDAGAGTPIHDHTVWGIVGVLRGAEVAERFSMTGGTLRSLGEARLDAGQIDCVSPRIGDIHQVRNAYADRSSISIHVYGADLCTIERHLFDRDTGAMQSIVSKPFDNDEPLIGEANAGRRSAPSIPR